MRSVEECKIVVVIIIIIYLYKISKASVNIFYSVNKDYKLKKNSRKVDISRPAREEVCERTSGGARNFFLPEHNRGPGHYNL